METFYDICVTFETFNIIVRMTLNESYQRLHRTHSQLFTACYVLSFFFIARFTGVQLGICITSIFSVSLAVFIECSIMLCYKICQIYA